MKRRDYRSRDKAIAKTANWDAVLWVCDCGRKNLKSERVCPRCKKERRQ